MATQRVCVLALCFLLCGLCCCGVITATPVPRSMKSRFNVRSSENTDLNCPSINYKFEQGTIRCEACQALSERMVEMVVGRGRDVQDVVEHDLCESVLEEVELAQRRNGVRYWARISDDAEAIHADDGEEEEGLNIREDERVGDTIEGSGSSKRSRRVPLTFHTPAEEKTLPCASFFLKRYCYELLGANSNADDDDSDDASDGDGDDEVGVDKCFAAFKRFKKNKKQLATKAGSSSSAPRRTTVESRQDLLHCVTQSLCFDTKLMSPVLPAHAIGPPPKASRRKLGTGSAAHKKNSRNKAGKSDVDVEEQKLAKLPSCHDDRLMDRLLEHEVQQFMKYAAAYGNEKFRYVEDHKSAGVFVRNPYAKGNELEGENELL